MRSLIEVRADALNGIADAQEWEEVEFMVDSGAGTTVIPTDEVKAVKPSDPDPDRNYKLAAGSLIQDKGTKTFNAQTEDEQWRLISAQVTDVDKALLSVSQIVRKEARPWSSRPRGATSRAQGVLHSPLSSGTMSTV